MSGGHPVQGRFATPQKQMPGIARFEVTLPRGITTGLAVDVTFDAG